MWNQVSSNLRSYGPNPVISWISKQGRIELSGMTFLNAISKAGNYLIDGCGFDNETSINVKLGNHWQAPVWKIAALVSGISLSSNSQNIFTFANQSSPGKIFVVSSDPFGMPAKDLPNNVENVSLEVRSHGDYFSPSFELSSEVVTRYLDLTSKLISDLEIKGRYGLIVSNGDEETSVLQALIPALTQNSVVLIDGLDTDDSIVQAEKLTTIITL